VSRRRRSVFRQTTRRLGAPLSVRLGTPDPDALGHFDPRTGEIVIDPAQSYAARLAVLVHELLHAVDEQIVASGITRERISHTWITHAAPHLLAALSALEVRIPRWRTMRRFYAAQKNERPGAEAPSRRLPRRGPSPKARRGAPRR